MLTHHFFLEEVVSGAVELHYVTLTGVCSVF